MAIGKASCKAAIFAGIMRVVLLSHLPGPANPAWKLLKLLPALCALTFAASGQLTQPEPEKHPERVWLVAGTHAALWTGSFIALDHAWYEGYPRTSFHFFNDNAEWNQMDKAGHVFTCYQLSRVSAGIWKWAGVPERRSLLLGSLSGMAFQTLIEIQDGYSVDWGFSWGDMAANAVGAGLFVSQELAWKQQRVTIKLSYWPVSYSDDLLERRNQILGSSLGERMLKDYNAQTYWLSGNLSSLLQSERLPGWLNIAIGYGADGMMGGRENVWRDKDGNRVDRTDIRRTRHFYLSPDIDLTKIKTKSGFLKNVLLVLNAIKFPAPALEIGSSGKVRLHAIYF